MDNETQGQATPSAAGKTKKKPSIFGKIGAFWKSGIKGKVICIVGVLMILGIIGAFVDDEEGGSGGGGGGGAWKYTGEYFDSVFEGFPKDEGVIYQHLPRAFGVLGMVLNDSYLPPIEVMQATKDGNLVTTEDSDRVVWVETKRRYEDGEELDEGYYIRRGSMEYETAMGAEKTVPRYVEVTDKIMLGNIKKAKQKLAAEEEAREAQRKAEEEAREAQRRAEEEAREAQRKAEEEAEKKAREEAAEQGAYELDIPIKSLCGFKLGAPPSQVRPLLLQNNDGIPVQDWVGDSDRWGVYRLVKPFRLFTHVSVDFEDNGVGKHLAGVTLMADITNVSEESAAKELRALVNLIKKKFGIEFKYDGYRSYSGVESYSWNGDRCAIEVYRIQNQKYNSLNLKFMAPGPIVDMDRLAKKARAEAGKKKIDLDADAGADDL